MNRFTDLAYNKPHRQHHYAHQINLVKKYLSESGSVLEIGMGGGFVSDSLKKLGYSVTTLDKEEELEPDIVSDVREIPQNQTFDLVLAAEVLEHIPYKDFLEALSRLQKITREYCIIALPYRGAYFGTLLRVNCSVGGWKINRTLHPYIRIPSFWKKVDIEEGGNHHWELGTKGHMAWTVKKDIRQYFSIKESFTHPTTPHHHFFVLAPL